MYSFVDIEVVVQLFDVLPTGLEVYSIQPGPMLVRCILILWTGDYLAQSEVGKFIQGGKLPCRRDKLEGKQSVFSETDFRISYSGWFSRLTTVTIT